MRQYLFDICHIVGHIDPDDLRAEARERDALRRIRLEDLLENAEDALRNGQHANEKLGVTRVLGVACVCGQRVMPRVVPSDHAREDDPECPDIVRARGVRLELIVRHNAFCKQQRKWVSNGYAERV